MKLLVEVKTEKSVDEVAALVKFAKSSGVELVAAVEYSEDARAAELAAKLEVAEKANAELAAKLEAAQKKVVPPDPDAAKLTPYRVRVKCSTGDYEYVEKAASENHVYLLFRQGNRSGRIVVIAQVSEE